MASSPIYKVYKDGEYIASCKHPMYAAILVGNIGESEIRYGHTHVVWNEGHEEIPASESYDLVTEVCLRRVDLINRRLRINASK